MKKNDVQIGGTYTAKVSDKVVRVWIDAANRHGGWDATNLTTKKKVRIKSAQRLRSAVKDGQPTADDDRPADAKAKARVKARDLPPDPNRCSTPRCKGEPSMTHLGKPLCQKCWDKHCAEEEAASRPEANPSVEVVTGQPVPDDPDAKPAAKNAPTAKRPRRGANGEAKPKRVSALDAAAQVLAKADGPMRCTDLITAMAEQGLWSSPVGKTPHATLYSAILREIANKGAAARFKKVERGQFKYKEAK